MLRLFISLYVFIAVALIGLSAILDNLVFEPQSGDKELQRLASALSNIESRSALESFAANNQLQYQYLNVASVNIDGSNFNESSPYIISYGEDGSQHIYLKLNDAQLVHFTFPALDSQDSFFWYSLTFFSLLALLIAAWSWPLWRDIRNLESSALSLQPDGSLVPVKLSKNSTVTNIADALHQLSNQVQALLRNQRELTSAVAHEFRTPLARLKFALESVPEGITRDSMREDLVELETLIQEMLEFSRSEQQIPELSFAEIHLQKLAEQLIGNLPQDKCAGIILSNTIGDVHLMADGHFLERAMMNLLNNALKYAKNKITINAYKQEGMVYISVEDDGDGVPESIRHKVFEPFFRPDPSRNRHHGGAGLGLAIVAKIQHWHEGDYQVVNSELGGAKFVLSYPQKQTV